MRTVERPFGSADVVFVVALVLCVGATVGAGCGTDSTVVGASADAVDDAIEGFDAAGEDAAATDGGSGGGATPDAADATDRDAPGDGGSTGVERDVCSGRDDGFHCGIADDGAHGAVLVCADGRLEDTQVCDTGCWSDGPTTASCLPVDPGTCADLGDGAWCAGALAIPGVPADALVRCARGETLAVETCAEGCEPGPAGAHACAGTEPNPCAGRVDGLWCSGELGVDEAGLLVTCRSGLAIGVADCEAGCVGNGAGGALCADVGVDPCADAPDGRHCASAIGGTRADALLTCAGGFTTAGELCADGCHERDGDDTCDGDAVDPCFDEADGLWCGGVIGGDANDLYRCQGGETGAREDCALWCFERDGDDVCANNEVEPCFDDPNGAYCGHVIGASDRRDDLYHCRDGRTERVDDCPDGCRDADPDVCLSDAVDPCFNDGDGWYCGRAIGGDAETLYECRGRATAAATPCDEGCRSMPAGVPDECNSAGGCCVDRPPGSWSRGFNACGGGGSHHGVDLGSPTGTPIPSGIAGTIVATREGQPNCPYNASTGTCPGYCINNFNYVKLRADCGDPRNPGNDLYVYYLHVDRVEPGLGEGSHVSRGQRIAYVGNSGCSSGPHIHLETVSVPRGSSAFLHTCNSFDPTTVFCE